MKNLKIFAFISLTAVLFSACSKENTTPSKSDPPNELESGWAVPLDQLILSQLPPDRIKSIDAPYFEPLGNNNLKSGEPVYLFRSGETVKVYPQRIMGMHEIVNDRVGEHFFAITFCPRTGSTIAWNRVIDGKVTEFGVSGHLFNENLIPYDRNENSFWSQMRLEGIKGGHVGDRLESGTLILTTGSTIYKAFPDALVLVDTSGQRCDTCSFKQSRDLGDPGGGSINLLGGDYFGMVKDGSALLFNYEVFDDPVKVYQTNFRGPKIVVGSEALQFIVAFRDNTGDTEREFSAVQNALPVVMKDNTGNEYDLTGLVVSGPDKGKRLPAPDSYTAHSFAWELIFNDLEVFGLR